MSQEAELLAGFVDRHDVTHVPVPPAVDLEGGDFALAVARLREYAVREDRGGYPRQLCGPPPTCAPRRPPRKQPIRSAQDEGNGGIVGVRGEWDGCCGGVGDGCYRGVSEWDFDFGGGVVGSGGGGEGFRFYLDGLNLGDMTVGVGENILGGGLEGGGRGLVG